MLRVLKPGGKVVICEFSQVSVPVLKQLYSFYLKFVLPRLSKLLAKNMGAYEYLAESILAWPNQKQLVGWLVEAGFTDAKYRNASFGVVAIHSARKAS
jgi:demethylmenaquinone methyltransferase/2-methoxy-6-polyprenyl-1,4-benzoquinol methylase